MNPLALAALISAVLSAGSAWQIQSWRFDAKEKHRVEQESAQALAAQRELRLLEARRTAAVVAAQNAAAGRLSGLRRDADGARIALVSLSDAAAQALREARASHDACLVRADALGDVLAQCGVRHQALAETCDRHVSDIKTLIDAWPKE